MPYHLHRIISAAVAVGVLMVTVAFGAESPEAVAKPSAPAAMVTVESNPAGATVFGNGYALGIAPVSVEVHPGERISLLLVRKDCQDAAAWLDGADLPPVTRKTGRRKMRVEMLSVAEAALSVHTTPAGAEIFLDDRRIGVSPAEIHGLLPGPHTLRLNHPNCYVEIMPNVELRAGEVTRVDAALKDKVVTYYRERIAKEPYVLYHYAELAHHYMLMGQPDDAITALTDGATVGIPKTDRPNPDYAARFRAEIERIFTHYFEYPPLADEAALRRGCYAVVEAARKSGIFSTAVANAIRTNLNRYENKAPLPSPAPKPPEL